MLDMLQSKLVNQNLVLFITSKCFLEPKKPYQK